MKVTVIIPTWKRVRKLEACLRSLEVQQERAELVLVVVRTEDTQTTEFLENWSKKSWLRVLSVDRPGVVHAENRALGYVRDSIETDVITFMDDDAIALPDWVRKIKQHFKDFPDSVALGGPDIIVSEPESYENFLARDVGILTWYGKVIGNHHRKSEGLRAVNVLKGVNFSFRRPYLRLLDEKLQGTDPARGNGVFWELDLCLWLAKGGGKIFFDPALIIHHDSNHSHFVPLAVIESTAHNLTYVLLTHLPRWRKIAFLLYVILIGNGHVPGIAKTLRECWVKRNLEPIRNTMVSLRGVGAGVRTYLFVR
jgi:glycosyltransferase involved in cell wall biosynthesis